MKPLEIHDGYKKFLISFRKSFTIFNVDITIHFLDGSKRFLSREIINNEVQWNNGEPFVSSTKVKNIVDKLVKMRAFL